MAMADAIAMVANAITAKRIRRVFLS